MAHSPATAPTFRNSLFVWGFGAAFYVLAFFHRVAPAVITNELMQDFAITGTALGNLSAFYFYSYVAMQIPTGILADRCGPRRLLTGGALVAAVGAVMFALAPTFIWAVTGRLLIGASVAVAFVGLLKLSINWFPPNQFALISGLTLFCGVAGAVFAGTPLRLLVDGFGWRNTILFSAALTLVVAGGSWIFIRDFPRHKGFRDFSPSLPPGAPVKRSGILPDIVEVASIRNALLLFFIPAGLVGAILTFSGLWGVPYLSAAYGVSPAFSAALSSALLTAWAVGGPFFGWLSDRIGNRKTVYVCGYVFAILGWTIIIYCRNLSMLQLAAAMVITGFCSGAMIISFAFAKESAPARLAGTVSGIVNMGVMIGPMILQPAVGTILDLLWEGNSHLGVRIYNVDAYEKGFSLMIIWALFSLTLLLFTRETHCRQLAEKQ
ncbi:MFS transporter [Desulforhopalus singaporensis]|uniref:Lysosomal dipeptide transporter MFSD1 n=1 Tax=Desulforhopalus singaporensis TaxID=91360 RepID=A0A1H0LBN3_9BACT|nr:MFS transporter [Desulforhopalus singaporensis]SDO65391.1 Sugar phosphate permease [Desulforhopalus singaporensis]